MRKWRTRRRNVIDAALATLVGAIVLAACWSGAGVSAQVASPRVYVLDGGTLGDSAVVAYLVVHPRGTLLWEAGAIPDGLIEADAPQTTMPELVRTFKVTASKTLKSQLAEIGYAPARITYFATSHYHFDHIANASDYRGGVWLVQKAERDAMFGGGPTPFGAEPSYYAPLKDAKTMLLNGDHDVFGDGTIVITLTPGHTPGHQALLVKLAHTGSVLLAGDIYHSSTERERPLDTIPAVDSSKDQSKATRSAVEALLKRTGAAIWIEHDGALFRSQKKAPAYYD